MNNSAIHIRCKKCHQYIAGPLTIKPLNKEPEIGFRESTTIQRVDFTIEPFCDLVPQSEEDVLLHAQWYDCWRREWSERCDDNAARRKMFVKATGSYGCCGPVGDATCQCGVKLGRVWADCIGPHWMFLYAALIERSDRVNGWWTILEDSQAGGDWIECVGEMQHGVRHGDWECWSNHVSTDWVDQRNKSRKIVPTKKVSIERSAFRLESWDSGKLVSCVSP